MNERIKCTQYTTVLIVRMRLRKKTCPKTGTGFYQQQKMSNDDEGNKQKMNNNGHTHKTINATKTVNSIVALFFFVCSPIQTHKMLNTLHKMV